MQIAYFVHDVTDPAVGKRVRMLNAAGASVTVLGFRRSDTPVTHVEGAPTVDLGRTYDARLAQRTLMVLQRRLSLGQECRVVRSADILLARNLEMLAIADAAQRRHAPNAALVYECLDVHRLLLADSAIGRALRFVERSLLRKVRLLIVSSPAFLSGYFEPKQRLASTWGKPVLVVENKVLDLAPATADTTRPRQPVPGPPWRIGWFGMIRCQRSLDILCGVASRNPGLVEIVIRGRPAYTAFADFDAQIARTPGIVFGGAYKPSELSALYGGVHFNWAIDYFEEGANSALLLPNRIYEGGPHGAVPIADVRTETGRWLAHRGLGVRLEAPGEELDSFLQHLTPAAYAQLRQALEAEPRATFVSDHDDCERLLRALELARGTDADAENARANAIVRNAFDNIHSVNRV